MRRELKLNSVEDAQAFGLKFGSELKGGETIALASDLGGGKTTIIKSIVAGSGSKDEVTSPTFTICNTYNAPTYKINHFDFYRLSDPGIIKHQLEESIEDKEEVVLIEWPEIIKSVLPKSAVYISIKVLSEQSRLIQIDCPDELSYLLEE